MNLTDKKDFYIISKDSSNNNRITTSFNFCFGNDESNEKITAFSQMIPECS